MGKYSASKDLDLNLKIRWYVVANRTQGAIYKDGSEPPFTVVERFTNPEGNLTERNLDSDKPGRGFASASGSAIHHSLDRRSAHHEQTAKHFAETIAKTLEVARKENRFQQLILVAEPHFLGLLRGALSSTTKNVVTHEIPREYIQISDRELYDRIHESIAESER